MRIEGKIRMLTVLVVPVVLLGTADETLLILH